MPGDPAGLAWAQETVVVEEVEVEVEEEERRTLVENEVVLARSTRLTDGQSTARQQGEYSTQLAAGRDAQRQRGGICSWNSSEMVIFWISQFNSIL